MKDTTLYEHLLGIQTPWFVQSVDMAIEAQRITVRVALKSTQVWADPTCEHARAHIHGWSERKWRHLDTCQFETLITARVPQLKYSDGSVQELATPWAERYARITHLMEAFVLKLLQSCPNTKSVCALTRLSWSSVNAVMSRAVERGLLARQSEPIKYLGLDEKSTERGHSYASILTDIDQRRVLDVVPGRSLEAASSLLGTLSDEQKSGVQAVAMDMWPAFMSAAKNTLPNADIVHDRFHIAKYLNDAVDKVRRSEHRDLSRAGDRTLKGSKYAWLKGYSDGRSSEAVCFRALHQLNLKTSRAWAIKEDFNQFWRYKYTASAKRWFDAWSTHAMRSRLEPIKVVVRMLRRHEAGLLAYSQHRISNACAEGFNSAIQLIKANARGFRSFTNYRARILFHCGKLDMRASV
ncbi:MAG: ISL3 family transposase [Brachymonas sp.]|nr:ISL3 family transposase [Brachymonas sp.]